MLWVLKRPISIMGKKKLEYYANKISLSGSMKFSPNCKTKKLRMINTLLDSFCSILNWEGALIWIRPRKIPAGHNVK